MTTMRQMMTERGATKTGSVAVQRIRGRLMLAPTRERSAVAAASAIALSDLDGRTLEVDGQTVTLRATVTGLRVEHPTFPSACVLIAGVWDMVADVDLA
jgi:hypothetical protein